MAAAIPTYVCQRPPKPGGSVRARVICGSILIGVDKTLLELVRRAAPGEPIIFGPLFGSRAPGGARADSGCAQFRLLQQIAKFVRR